MPTTQTLYDRLTNLEAAVFGGPNVGGAVPNPSGALPAVIEATLLVGAGSEPPIVLSGSADALASPGYVGTAVITTAGVDAVTLATPVAGGQGTGDDGKFLWVFSTTAQAHTVTTASNKINGNKHIATFAAAIGNNVLFYAYNGIWWMFSQVGITLS